MPSNIPLLPNKCSRQFSFKHPKSSRVEHNGHFDQVMSVDLNCFLKDVRAKTLKQWFFSADFTIERWWVSDVRNVKEWEVTDFVLERTCPEEHPKSEKSGFFSE